MTLDRPLPPSIVDGFRAMALRYAQNDCIHDHRESWTYARVDRASDRVAAALSASGIVPGDRVALLCPNRPAFAVVYLGILKAGATVVPLNLRLHPKEIAFILADAEVKALCFDETQAALANDEAVRAATVPIRVQVSDEQDGEGLVLDGLSDVDAPIPDHHATRHERAVIIYTSGTTGRPKGAILSHGNLVANACAVADTLRMRAGEDRVLVVLPMFHAFAATVGMLAPLLHGLALVPVPRFEPALVSSAIATHRATIFLGVPSMFQLLVRGAESLTEQWRTIRCCVSGGAALPKALLKAFEERYDLPILEGDGPTECSPVTCVNPLDGLRKPGSVGLPLPGVEMSIRSPVGEELPVGELGEVCVRGPNVMQGYWRLPEATQAVFFDDWLRTGDLGYRDADGYYFLVDRLKDLIISAGANVYPRIIEEVLYRHPGVAEVAVVGEPHRLQGEVPIAHIVKAADVAELNESELRAWCRDNLGVHEIPRRFILRDALPKNAAGKILKRELRRGGEVERGIDLGPDSH